MPRPARPWFRAYVEMFHDPKIRRLAPAQKWLWVAVMGAARESCEPGRLVIAAGVPMTESDLADYAGMRRPDVIDGLELMFKLGLVVDEDGTWVVPKFAERQYESDNVTARTAKHRSKERNGNDVGTFQPRSQEHVRNTPETETETETDKTLSVSRAEPFDTDFEIWWLEYPRKIAKAEARKVYRARRREGIEHSRLMAAVGNYKQAKFGEDPKFIKHGASFLAKDGPWSEWELGEPEPSTPAFKAPSWKPDEVRRCKVCANTGNYVKNGAVTACKVHSYG